MADGAASAGGDLWEDLPLFAPKEATIPRIPESESAEGLPDAIGALSHLLYDEDSPREIAEDLRDEGNTLFKHGNPISYRRAIEQYTRSIEVDCDDADVMAAAYANRAAAHMKLKNYGHALRDAESALEKQPGHLKACYRAAVSARMLGKLSEAIAHCDSGLNALRNAGRGSLDKSPDATLLTRERRFATQAREKAIKEQAEREKRYRQQSSASQLLEAALKRRGATVGLPLFAQQRKASNRVPTLEPSAEGDEMFWPVLLVYPDAPTDGAIQQTDFLESVSEMATIDDVVGAVFPDGAPPPPWDVNAAHASQADSLVVHYKTEWTRTVDQVGEEEAEEFVGSTLPDDRTGRWKSVSRGTTLADLVARPDYVVPMFPVLFVGLRKL